MDLVDWLQESKEPVQLLFTDVTMQGMNGRDLAERVIAIRAEITALFVSGYTANVIVHHGVLKPGTESFAKPYTQRRLAQRLREILNDK